MEKDERLVRLGRRLRELREERGLSRKQLVDRAGLSERAIIKWELGEREPGWFNILALCAALGVECTAFAVEPSPAPAPSRGRPRKVASGDEPAEPAKKSTGAASARGGRKK